MTDALVASSPWTNKRFKTSHDNVATKDVEEVILRVLRRHVGEPGEELLRAFNTEFMRPVFTVDGEVGATDGIQRSLQTWEPTKPHLLGLLLDAWNPSNKLADGEGAEFTLRGRTKLSTRFASQWVIENHGNLVKQSVELKRDTRTDEARSRIALGHLLGTQLFVMRQKALAAAREEGDEILVEHHVTASTMSAGSKGKGSGIVACAKGMGYVRAVIAEMRAACQNQGA